MDDESGESMEVVPVDTSVCLCVQMLCARGGAGARVLQLR